MSHRTSANKAAFPSSDSKRTKSPVAERSHVLEGNYNRFDDKLQAFQNDRNNISNEIGLMVSPVMSFNHMTFTIYSVYFMCLLSYWIKNVSVKLEHVRFYGHLGVSVQRFFLSDIP